MKEEFYDLWTTGRGLYVLLGLLVWGIFISPLLIGDGLTSAIFVECAFAMILIAGVFTTPCGMAARLAMLLIACSAVLARILDKSSHTNLAITSIDYTLAIITLVAFSFLIIKHFLIDKTLLRYRIAAAVAVYLIFGVLWARIYEFVYLINPAAFSSNEPMNPFSLVYFSFVTLLTLGYGDIVPVSTAARSLAIFEGVVGQLYIVILISTLVSEFSALSIKSTQEEQN